MYTCTWAHTHTHTHTHAHTHTHTHTTANVMIITMTLLISVHTIRLVKWVTNSTSFNTHKFNINFTAWFKPRDEVYNIYLFQHIAAHTCNIFDLINTHTHLYLHMCTHTHTHTHTHSLSLSGSPHFSHLHHHRTWGTLVLTAVWISFEPFSVVHLLVPEYSGVCLPVEWNRYW